jgi:hypothetical protein
LDDSIYVILFIEYVINHVHWGSRWLLASRFPQKLMYIHSSKIKYIFPRRATKEGLALLGFVPTYMQDNIQRKKRAEPPALLDSRRRLSRPALGSHPLIGRLSSPLGFQPLLSLSAAAFVPAVWFDSPRRGVSNPFVLCRCRGSLRRRPIALVVVHCSGVAPGSLGLVGGVGTQLLTCARLGFPGLTIRSPFTGGMDVATRRRCRHLIVVVSPSSLSQAAWSRSSSSCCTPPLPPLHVAPLLLFNPLPPPLRVVLLLLLLTPLVTPCSSVSSSLSIIFVVVDYRRRRLVWSVSIAGVVLIPVVVKGRSGGGCRWKA